MKIYTSYFANLKNLPDSIVPIAICGAVPAGYKGWRYTKLAPKLNFFKVYKETLDKDYYIRNFKKEIFDVLDPNRVVEELSVYANTLGSTILQSTKQSTIIDFLSLVITSDFAIS